jgi:UDP-glucose 4-epimerase
MNNSKTTKCLVTGGAGFIGSWVVDNLVDKGYDVTVIDNFSTGQSKNLNPKADLIIEDINKVDWDSIGKFDLVFHLAAIPRVQYSIEHPLETHHANVTGTLKVLEYCRKNNAKIISQAVAPFTRAISSRRKKKTS